MFKDGSIDSSINKTMHREAIDTKQKRGNASYSIIIHVYVFYICFSLEWLDAMGNERISNGLSITRQFLNLKIKIGSTFNS